MTTDHNARQHAAAMTTIDQLINDLPTTVYAAAAAEQVRAQRANLRLVRSMLLRGRVASTTLDQLAPLCGCNTGPDTDGPEQDCPIHGDGQTFVALFRWGAAVAAAAHALVGGLQGQTESGTTVDNAPFDRLHDLLTAGPWNAGVTRAPGGGHASADWLAEHGEAAF
jgi:hypothetical protein